MKETVLSNKILSILLEHVDCQFNATTLDRMLYEGKDYKKDKKRINSIRVTLTRLVKRGSIIRHKRGFYGAKVKPETLKFLENPPTTLHGIKLECMSSRILQKRIQGISAGIYTNELLDWFKAMDFEESTNNRFGKSLWWDGRRVRITVHQKGLIEIFINSSKNPLVYPDFKRLLDFLSGYLEPLTPFDRRDVRLVQVGVGKDYKKLRLEGVSSVKLQKFLKDWSQIYYKEDIGATRIEHHLTVSMPLDEALNTLELLTSPVSFLNGKNQQNNNDSNTDHSNYSNEGGMFV